MTPTDFPLARIDSDMTPRAAHHRGWTEVEGDVIDRKNVTLDRGWGIVLRDVGIEPELRRRLTKLGASAPLPERVRSVLLESLPRGAASIQVTASHLGLSPRTLEVVVPSTY